MLAKFNSTTVIAAGTSAALVAFAFDQARSQPTVTMSEVALCIAAAVTCLLPVFIALARHKFGLARAH